MCEGSFCNRALAQLPFCPDATASGVAGQGCLLSRGGEATESVPGTWVEKRRPWRVVCLVVIVMNSLLVDLRGWGMALARPCMAPRVDHLGSNLTGSCLGHM